MPIMAPVAKTQAPANSQQVASAAKKVATIPFTRAARRKSQLSFNTNPVALSAVGQTQLGPIQIPAAGFLRYIELTVVATTATNVATPVLAADAPFNVIAYISVTNAAGDTMMVPLTGYQLMLMNKWGALSEDPPFCDPRLSGYSVTTGSGGTAGSFSFTLRIPFELDAHDAFCAVPNLAANKSYQIQLILATEGTVYTTNPTNPPTVAITGVAEFWTQPNPTNGVGTPQEVAPLGAGSVSLWRLQTIPLTQGDKIVQLTNVGNVIRMFIATLRTGAGARDGADIPAVWQIILNNDTLFYLPDAVWFGDMQSSSGYTGGTLDAAGGGDTGVRVWHYPLEQNGRIRCDGPRDQYLPTLDSTLLQLRGTSYGAGAATLEVITNEIKPVSAAALYNVK